MIYWLLPQGKKLKKKKKTSTKTAQRLIALYKAVWYTLKKQAPHRASTETRDNKECFKCF